MSDRTGVAQTYIVSRSTVRLLHKRSYEAQQEDHREVCGVLVEAHRRRLRLRFLQNRAQRPGSWKLRRTDVDLVRRSLRRGSQAVGTFHSHPVSHAIPSASDLRATPVGSLLVIYDVCGRGARLWRIVRDGRVRRAIELKLRRTQG